MRLIVIFILAIIVGAGLYTAYGVFTFEAEKPAPLVFKEPDIKDLQSLGYSVGEYNAGKVEVALTPEQKQQASLAVTKIAQAMTIYQDNEKKATPRLQESLNILNGAIGSGILPAYFLNVKDVLHPERSFDTLKFNPTAVKAAMGTAAASCDNSTNVMIGDEADNTLSCTSTEVSGDQIFIGGPGNDTISDTLGDRIINAGGGDDTITLGPGRNIIILEENWGKDSLTVDCSGASIAANEVPAGFAVPWVSKFTNFIVLSPRIQQDSVNWQGNILTNASTGDSLTVSENCFTLVKNK